MMSEDDGKYETEIDIEVDLDPEVSQEQRAMKKGAALFLELAELLAQTDDWMEGDSPGFAISVKDEMGTTFVLEIYLTDEIFADEQPLGKEKAAPHLKLVH